MKKLTRLEKFGFGAGDVAVNISMMSISLFLTYFYTDILGLKPEHMAILFLLVRLVDAFTDPLMGWITDRIHLSQGRYRPWLALGAAPFGLSVYLVFAAPELSYSGKLAWACLTYTFNTLMFTVVTIPYISLIGVISDSPQERLRANAWRFVMAKGAVLLVTTSLTALATWLGGGDKAQGFGLAMAIMAILGTVALWFCYATTTERVAVNTSNPSISIQLKHLVGNDQWRILAITCVLVMTGYLIRGSIAFHYATYYLGMDGGLLFAVFMGMWAVGGITATLISTWLTQRYCKLKVFRYSLFAACIIGIGMFFAVEPGDILLGIVGYFLLCLASDINTPIFWSSISEVADYGEYKSGVRVSGLIFGSISFLQKLGMGIAGLIVGLLLAHFGYTPGSDQSDHTLTGIALMLSLLPGLIFFSAGLIMHRYIISNEFYHTHLTSIPDNAER